MIEPVIVALTTVVFPDISTNNATISSAALPSVTFSRPPIDEPARLAICSVARRIHCASGMMAAAAAANTHNGDAWKYARATERGMRPKAYRKCRVSRALR